MTRQRIRRAFNAWASVGAVVLVVWGFALGSTAYHNHGASQSGSKALHRQGFWLVVAGKENAGANISVGDKLAIDLHAALGKTNPDARLPLAIREFRGDSNSYGGVTDELGLDPFNGASCGCRDSGPLTTYMQTRLLTIKRGGIAQVLKDDHPRVKHYSAEWAWVMLLLWAASLPVFSGLPWALERRHEMKAAAAYPSDDRRLVLDMQKMIRELPASDPRRADLVGLCSGLTGALNKRVKHGTDDGRDSQIDQMKQDAQLALAAYRAADKELAEG